MKFKYFISPFFFILLCTSCHNQWNHDAKVFIHAADMLGLTIPDEPHSFIFITTEGCTGCKPLALAYAQANPSDSVTFITTQKLMKLYGVRRMDNIIVDSSALIEKLNWSLHGIIEVRTTYGKVRQMYDYDISNIVGRFYN